MPRTVQTFGGTSPLGGAQWTGRFFPLPGLFHMHSSHSLDFTSPDSTPFTSGCCSAPFPSSCFTFRTFRTVEAGAGREKGRSFKFSLLPLVQHGSNTFICLTKLGMIKPPPHKFVRRAEHKAHRGTPLINASCTLEGTDRALPLRSSRGDTQPS